MKKLLIALTALAFLCACGKKAPLRAPNTPPPSDTLVSVSQR